MQNWFDTPPGSIMLDWEQQSFDATVADLFGYHALQLGNPAVRGLRANRMPHRWLALETALGHSEPQPDLVSDFSALPFSAASLDLVLLPHTLEQHPRPHDTLREVERVLVPEGRVVVSGINPLSLWGLMGYRSRFYQRMGFGRPYLPAANEFIHPWRLRDWLRLLGFEVLSCHFGCGHPAMRSERWLQRFEWMDRVGRRWWPILGAGYFVVAVKRVRGMRLLEPGWKPVNGKAAASVPLARRSGDHQA